MALLHYESIDALTQIAFVAMKLQQMHTRELLLVIYLQFS